MSICRPAHGIPVAQQWVSWQKGPGHFPELVLYSIIWRMQFEVVAGIDTCWKPLWLLPSSAVIRVAPRWQYTHQHSVCESLAGRLLDHCVNSQYKWVMHHVATYIRVKFYRTLPMSMSPAEVLFSFLLEWAERTHTSEVSIVRNTNAPVCTELVKTSGRFSNPNINGLWGDDDNWMAYRLPAVVLDALDPSNVCSCSTNATVMSSKAMARGGRTTSACFIHVLLNPAAGESPSHKAVFTYETSEQYFKLGTRASL